MNLPPQMIELFLRSAGAPKEVLEMVQLIQREGFSKAIIRPMANSDQGWAKFGEEKGSRTGVVLAMEGETSRALIAVYLEGVNDEVLENIKTLGALSSTELPVLPAST